MVRPVDTMGSHTPGYNHVAIGMCLIGGLDMEGLHSGDFDPRQVSATIILSAAFMKEFPKAQVLGHKELDGYPDSICPALDMNGIRRGIEELPKGSLRPLTVLLERLRINQEHFSNKPK